METVGSKNMRGFVFPVLAHIVNLSWSKPSYLTFLVKKENMKHVSK